MKLFFCPKPATALIVFCALVAIVSAQETPIPTSMDTTVTDGTTTATMDTPAPTNVDGTTTATMETPSPTVHVHTDDMDHDHEETMGPTATGDAEGDGAAAIGGGARMTAVVSCALAALAAGAAWGL
ncbi:expressed unknown protein [Ectocarpus siliculosus]|uniref:Uncharacterized protein n=1 Tax=Ectocarpus siliculosus TaxID=2880 RepID=D8LDS1_ECTSI|nr:expressed unknown protein [Ectocarpus siliculosus]|eukprot:CBN78478.1 expressed unknown protein [Ectocarpus siliculosus]